MAQGVVRPAGGLPAVAKAQLTPENIKAGVHIKGSGLDVTGTFTADATAVAGQILSGQTAYVKGNKVTGTIPGKAAATYTPGTSDQVLAAGQYLEGAQTIRGDANLAAGNILSGVSIFGVTGTRIPAKEILTLGAGFFWRGGGGFFSWNIISSANSDYIESKALFREYPNGGSYVSTVITRPIKKSFTGHMSSSAKLIRYNGAMVGTAPVEFVAGTNLEFVTPAGTEWGFALWTLLMD